MKNPIMQIPIARTDLKETEIQSVLTPLKSGWLVQGPKVLEFEKRWSEFTGAKHSIAVTSCTTGLHLSLVALNICPGDEIIVPAFTWISTANVVEHLGGKVVFCDINLNTFNLDIKKLESLISKRTKAIIPVHLFGQPAEMEIINKLAAQNNLFVIEDAACGFGAKIKGKHVGNFGHTGVFSFHPRKAITTGEGGMVTTNDSELAKKIRCLRDHGASISDLQRHLGPKPYLLADHPEAGFNQRMTDIQASLGSEQMLRAKNVCDERSRIAKLLDEGLSDLNNILTPLKMKNIKHGYQSYACLAFPDEVFNSLKFLNEEAIKKINNKRNKIMEDLLERGISTRPATHAVHMLSFYKNKYNLNNMSYPFAFAADHCSISLPLFHGMTPNEIDYLIQQVKAVFKKCAV